MNLYYLLIEGVCFLQKKKDKGIFVKNSQSYKFFIKDQILEIEFWKGLLIKSPTSNNGRFVNLTYLSCFLLKNNHFWIKMPFFILCILIISLDKELPMKENNECIFVKYSKSCKN